MSTNEVAVQTALKLLSDSLEPYIQKTLSPFLGDALQWIDILHELDKIKGKTPKIYSPTDVQCQLRVITERLGTLGYPFGAGDPHRMMSIYGNELRLVRNRWAHGASFTVFEAMRAVDTVFIMLTHIGDHGAAAEAADTRASLVSELVSQDQKLAAEEDSERVLATVDDAETEELDNDDTGSDSESPESPRDRFTGIRSQFEAWEIVVTGDVETLDNLPKKSAKESVRSSIEEIVEFEGPIHKDRLTKLVGYAYGLGKVHEARAKKIASQINGTGCFVDKDKFVWPADVNPSEWKIYRTSPIGSSRPFTEISPVEIANAMADILTRIGEISAADLRRSTLKTFGRRKETKNFSMHLDRGLTYAIVQGLVTQTGTQDQLMAANLLGQPA